MQRISVVQGTKNKEGFPVLSHKIITKAKPVKSKLSYKSANQDWINPLSGQSSLQDAL